MHVASIQPHRLIEELQRATLPVEETPLQETPPPAPAKVGLVAKLKGAFRRKSAAPQKKLGVPHGVEKVLVRARNVRVLAEQNAIAYCNSHSYEVVGHLPQGDDQPYPQSVTTQVTEKLPRTGDYNILMEVSVNGTVDAYIQKFEPATVS